MEEEDMKLTRADEVRAFIARTPLAQEMGLRCEVRPSMAGRLAPSWS